VDPYGGKGAPPARQTEDEAELEDEPAAESQAYAEAQHDSPEPQAASDTNRDA